ncbi:MAG TPA: histidine kinase [Acidimicrobiales bacterium]|nr:histidine kinase [Acidimicrobiales bacterium]
MGSEATTVVGSDDAPSVAATLRWTVPLALVAIGLLVAVTVRAHPAPGLHGWNLVVSAALVGCAGGLLAFERVASRPGPARIAIVVVMVGSAATLVGVQPDGPGFLAIFIPVSAAAFRLRRRDSVTVAVFAVGSVALAAALGPPRAVDSVILEELAVAAYFGCATFAGQFIRADEQSQFVIAQLEATRAAQAQAAALGERQRLAREMHDVLAHSLSGLVLNLEGARVMAGRGVGGAELEDVITRAHRLARTGLEEAQRAIGLLRDDTLPGPDGLDELATQFEADTGVPCRFAAEGEQRQLGTDARLTVYRVAQEALTNIRKHAAPDRVELHLYYEPGGTRLVVEDHRTTDHPRPPGGGTGYGLTGMRERAELLGGTLRAGPTPSGFRVELWAPA